MFARTDAAFEACVNHLSEIRGDGTPIENLLVQQLLVLLCADIQKTIYQAVENRTAPIVDSRIRSFSSFAAKRIVRSVKKNELAGFLGAFGSDLKTTFNTYFSEADFTRYDAAVDQRHDIAHSTLNKQLTIGDFGQVLTLAKKIIGCCVDLITNDGKSLQNVHEAAKI
jgi:hypothetical protein